MTTPAPRKKLIEVALPLEAINKASAREKSIRHGHPSTLHLWWSRKPLATSRAVIFASLVDDPDNPAALPAFVAACRELPIGANAHISDTPRMRLFDFMERLVTWEGTTDEATLATARKLIRVATEGNPPPLLDPFAGGGSIPLEAQRLGLEAHASDLNPVAVMINKAQIEIPPRFAGQPPVNPVVRAAMFGGAAPTGAAPPAAPARKKAQPAHDTTWRGATGLAADVRHYGAWMRARAWERIGHLYPAHHGETVIAWVWARTVISPHPAIDAHVPLVRSFILSKKQGRMAWVQPVVQDGQVSYVVRREQDGHTPPPDEGTVNRKGGRCIITGTPMSFDHIRAEGKAGRMGAVLMAIVTEGAGGRNYHSPTDAHVEISQRAIGMDYHKPGGVMPLKHRNFQAPVYGMYEFGDLFTPRQLVALTTFSDLVAEARAQAYADARAAGLPDDGVPLRDGGSGALAYAEAVGVYLAFGVDKGANLWSSLTSWMSDRGALRETFARQALPMMWDYAEANPFSNSGGGFAMYVERIVDVISLLCAKPQGKVRHADAVTIFSNDQPLISTDPPYYDNIGYADLSDYFYVWMRRMLYDVYPDIFGTLLVPKVLELIAAPNRFEGSREAATQFFENGLRQVFEAACRIAVLDYPMTVYYAFKQQEEDQEVPNEAAIDVTTVRASTGWETILSGLINSGFTITGTWPVRTESSGRITSIGTNALTSSIVLVCRPRPADAPVGTRRAFLDGLRRELPAALRDLQTGSIAPVDLAQASIGPGMAVYSRYSKVQEADGRPLSVRTALGLINQQLDAYLAEQDGDIDADTRFAVAWFEQFGFRPGGFGLADTLARAKNTSVSGVELAGLAHADAGIVQLVHWADTPLDSLAYDPARDTRPTVWEACHHLIERHSRHGERGAALLYNRLPGDMASAAHDLAYRLYNICERKSWADHARDYNRLVSSWAEIASLAASLREAEARNDAIDQPGLF